MAHMVQAQMVYWESFSAATRLRRREPHDDLQRLASRTRKPVGGMRSCWWRSCWRAEPLERSYREATGIPYFSAVCVSEKRATFTSTRPAALPASITSRSEMAGEPL